MPEFLVGLIFWVLFVAGTATGIWIYRNPKKFLTKLNPLLKHTERQVRFVQCVAVLWSLMFAIGAISTPVNALLAIWH
jgi:hypothetical protein